MGLEPLFSSSLPYPIVCVVIAEEFHPQFLVFSSNLPPMSLKTQGLLETDTSLVEVEIMIAEGTVKIPELRLIGPVRLQLSRRNRTPVIERVGTWNRRARAVERWQLG
jgi:hypothetical protein